MTHKDRASAFIARYRDAFPDVLDAWPVDHVPPAFPGILTRLGLAEALRREFEEVERETKREHKP
jgi:hypothetical protein